MEKRERLERAIAGYETARPPIALWRHWQGDDQRAADLAQSVANFQKLYDWDVAVVMPSRYFSVRDYGLQDAWQGAITGARDVIKPMITRSLHWTELRSLDPNRGDFLRQIECLKLLEETFAQDMIPFVQVIYSPLTQAAMLSGRDEMLSAMRRQPDRFRTGLNTLTESTLRFIEALRRQTQISGILYICEFASHHRMTEREYRDFGEPYNTKLLDLLSPEWWLNSIQVTGQSPMLHVFDDYPVQVLTWADRETRLSLGEARDELSFKGALWGGLSAHQHLLHGTPATVRDAIRDAITTMQHRRFIVGCGGIVPTTTPWSNLRAARMAVER